MCSVQLLARVWSQSTLNSEPSSRHCLQRNVCAMHMLQARVVANGILFDTFKERT